MRWYAGQSAAVKAHADTVLDALRAGGLPSYTELATQARLGRSGWRGAAVAAALTLAYIGCEPPPGPDERPDVPMLAHA